MQSGVESPQNEQVEYSGRAQVENGFTGTCNGVRTQELSVFQCDEEILQEENQVEFTRCSLQAGNEVTSNGVQIQELSVFQCDEESLQKENQVEFTRCMLQVGNEVTSNGFQIQELSVLQSDEEILQNENQVEFTRCTLQVGNEVTSNDVPAQDTTKAVSKHGTYGIGISSPTSKSNECERHDTTILLGTINTSPHSKLWKQDDVYVFEYAQNTKVNYDEQRMQADTGPPILGINRRWNKCITKFGSNEQVISMKRNLYYNGTGAILRNEIDHYIESFTIRLFEMFQLKTRDKKQTVNMKVYLYCKGADTIISFVLNDFRITYSEFKCSCYNILTSVICSAEKILTIKHQWYYYKHVYDDTVCVRNCFWEIYQSVWRSHRESFKRSLEELLKIGGINMESQTVNMKVYLYCKGADTINSFELNYFRMTYSEFKCSFYKKVTSVICCAEKIFTIKHQRYYYKHGNDDTVCVLIFFIEIYQSVWRSFRESFKISLEELLKIGGINIESQTVNMKVYLYYKGADTINLLVLNDFRMTYSEFKCSFYKKCTSVICSAENTFTIKHQWYYYKHGNDATLCVFNIILEVYQSVWRSLSEFFKRSLKELLKIGGMNIESRIDVSSRMKVLRCAIDTEREMRNSAYKLIGKKDYNIVTESDIFKSLFLEGLIDKSSKNNEQCVGTVNYYILSKVLRNWICPNRLCNHENIWNFALGTNNIMQKSVELKFKYAVEMKIPLSNTSVRTNSGFNLQQYHVPRVRMKNWPHVFYHFTDIVGFIRIMMDMKIKPSLVPEKSRFGPGVYFTTLSPCSPTGKLMWNNYYGNMNYADSRVECFLAIDMRGDMEDFERPLGPRKKGRNIFVKMGQNPFLLNKDNLLHVGFRATSNRVASPVVTLVRLDELNSHIMLERYHNNGGHFEKIYVRETLDNLQFGRRFLP